MPPPQPSPEDQVMVEIKKLREELSDLRSRPFRIPVLGADPNVADPTNFWLLEDGRIRVRTKSGTIKEYAPVTTPGGSGSTVPPPASYTPQGYATEFGYSFAETYRNGGASVGGGSGQGVNRLFYGNGDTYNKENMSLVGFGDQLVNALASNSGGPTARVDKVEVYINNLWTWNNAGGDLRISTHSNAGGAPGSYSGEVEFAVSTVRVGKPSEGWYELPARIGEQMRTGAVRGIGFRQGSQDRGQYGYARMDSIRLRLTYVK